MAGRHAGREVPPQAVRRLEPQFTLHQAELFQEGSALTNAVADFDNDGDLDIFVGFNNKPSRMYRNDRGTFAEVAAEVGLDATGAIRTSAWGDYDGDGNLDLFIASVSAANSWARLFRNEATAGASPMRPHPPACRSAVASARPHGSTSTTTAVWTSSWPCGTSRTCSSK